MFSSSPNSFTSGQIDGTGRTDWSNNIIVNQNTFGDNRTQVNELVASQFMHTIAHEMLHVNEPLYERLASNSFRMGNPLGYFHRNLDERAERLSESLWKEFLKRRDRLRDNACWK